MQFIYQGTDLAGDPVTGKIDAANEDLAMLELSKRGIVTTEIDPQGSASEEISLTGFKDRYFPEKVSIEDLIIFCRQMSALTRAGVPLLRALSGLIDSLTNKTLKETLITVMSQVESGNALAVALSTHPKVFGNIFVSMISVGENTGNLDEAFVQVASYLDLERETKKRLKQATRYPIMVVSSICVAMTIINIFVIPAFSKVFKQFGSELPFATKVLIATSNFSVNYWWAIIAAIVIVVVGTRRHISTEEGRLQWDKMVLKLPLLGNIFERIILARFARVFSMLASAGVPILASLTNVSQAMGNSYMCKKVVDMRSAIERGESFTRTAINANIFSPLVVQMVAVGEETGQIDQMLLEVARFYEEEVDYDLKKLGDAIEPILLVVMGIMVLILALGIFLPMWDLGGAAKGS